MGEENWPENVVRSRGHVVYGMFGWRDLIPRPLGKVIADGPRPIICADCGKAVPDGLVVHLKPTTYEVRYGNETFFLERHIGVGCGCAAKRELV